MSLRDLFDAMLRDPDPEDEKGSMVFALLLWCFSLGFAISVILIFGVILVWLPWSLLLLLLLFVVWGLVSIRDRVE
jgi:hypothetical protein